MKSNYPMILSHTLAHEGGWADHPKDPGGATMKGVTIAVFRKFKGRAVTKTELRNISEADLQAIYRGGYWGPIQGDQLPSGMDYTAFDASVNSGVGRGPKWLQKALGVPADGKVGRNTVAAARANSDPVAVIKRANANRTGFLKGLRTWGTFGKGWSRRVAEVEAFSVVLAAGVAAAREEVLPAQKASTRDKAATTAPVAAGGGSFTLDGIPDWAIVVVLGLAVVAVVFLMGQARHNRNRAEAYALASREIHDV